MPGRAVIARQRRLFEDFFKIDELLVTHRQADGTMSSVQRRLIFERGDSVAVLLFNRDKRAVVLVEQFKAAALARRPHHRGRLARRNTGGNDRRRRSAGSGRDPRNARGDRLQD
jgi:hypothetical protein